MRAIPGERICQNIMGDNLVCPYCDAMLLYRPDGTHIGIDGAVPLHCSRCARDFRAIPTEYAFVEVSKQ